MLQRVCRTWRNMPKRSFSSGIPSGFDQILNNPATMEAAKKMMGDPEAMKKLQDMMKDPGTQAKVNAMMNDPSFRSKVDHLRKEANLPGADMPITDTMMEQAKRMMGFGTNDENKTVDINGVENNVNSESSSDIDAALEATRKAKESAEALLHNSNDNNSFSNQINKININNSQAIVELREYQLHPHLTKEYIKVTADTSDLRKSLVPLRMFTTCDTGGTLNVATHFYYYSKGIEERDRQRNGMISNDKWQDYLADARPCVQQQSSRLYIEAPIPKSLMSGLKLLQPLRKEYNEDPIYEICRYKLKQGIDIIPRFLDLYLKSLPSSIAQSDESSELCSLLHTDIGTTNEILEIWRHGNGVKAMQKNKFAIQSTSEYKASINGINEITLIHESSIHRPLSFSNWK